MDEKNAMGWYVLRSSKTNVLTSKLIEEEMASRQETKDVRHPVLEYYIPKFVMATDSEGQATVEKPLCLNYVFLHSTLNETLDFRKACPILSILKDGRSDKNENSFAYITEDKMRMFMVMVHAYKDSVPLCNPESVRLNEGDTVRVASGDFKGVEGVLMTRTGVNGGTVILRVTNSLFVPTLKIDMKDLQILNFGKEDERYYGILRRKNAKIRNALRSSFSPDGATDEELSVVKEFVSQFGNTEIPKPNFRARYDALLMMAHTVLRNPEKAMEYIYKCDSALKTLADNQSKLSVVIALFACTGKRAYAELAHAYSDKWNVKDLKGKKKELMDDLAYYESHADKIHPMDDFKPSETPKTVVPINTNRLPKGRGGFITFANGYIREQKRNGKILPAERNAKVIKNFSKYLDGDDISFAKFTKETVEGYRDWLTAKGLADSSVYFYVRNLSCLYNYAGKRGLCTKEESPFKEVKLRPMKKAEEVELKVITLDDLRRLYSLDLTSYDKALSLTRDIFLFSVYTHGMRPINILFLKCSDISDGRLTYTAHTIGRQEQTSIKWTRQMQEIADRYASTTPYLFPCVTSSNHETAISQYKIAIRSINHNLKKLGKLLDLSFSLSMNVASYSWKGIMESIMDEVGIGGIM